MTDDALLKKLEYLIDSKLDTRFTPVKELAEVIDHKVRKIEAMESMTARQIQMIKDQQSVMNRKLDEHSAYFDNQVLPALITIEDKIDKYSDMYKLPRTENPRFYDFKAFKRFTANLSAES